MKKVISLLVLFVLTLSLAAPALALGSRNTSGENGRALQLAELGLIQGVGISADGTKNFDLDRQPNRTEALVMLLRILGKDEEAKNYNKTHPFSDVPQWAEGYVSYAFDKHLTSGVSDKLFDSEGLASAEMFLTFTLRALGYSDGVDADFAWNNPWELAGLCGIVPVAIDKEHFLRADLVNITCAALYAYVKGTSAMLQEKLIESGVFTQQKFAAAFPKNPFNQSLYSKSLSKTTASFGHIKQVIDAPICTVILGNANGLPHGSSAQLSLVYKVDCAVKTGEIIMLPLPRSNYIGVLAMPDKIELSEDGKLLQYSCHFDKRLVAADGTVIHEAGTYSYETDLFKATTKPAVLGR